MLRSTLSLLSISGLLVSLVDPVQASGVTWVTPSDGDVYKSGDTLVGRWTPDSGDPVPSPSFRLCVNGLGRRSRHDDEDDDGGDGDGEDGDSGGGGDTADDDDGSCGAPVWPTIQQSDPDGSYFIHMTLPNVSTSVPHCYLQMVDDNGEKSSSPMFSFDPSDADAKADDDSAAVADQADKADSADPSSSSAPSSSASSPSSSHSSHSSSAPSSSASSPSSSHSSHSSPSSPGTPTQTSNLQLTSPTPLSLAESHLPAPTAAYAVPLSLVLSVLLAAGGLSLHQRRKLRAERAREHAALKSRSTLSRHSTLSFAGFMALGRGPSPSHDPSSRSTSVNMMRAWQRDVSRYTHDPSSAPADDDTYVAKTDDDALSAHSHASLPKRTPAPRPQTREPFNFHASRHPAAMPAGTFRAGLSPRVPYPHPNDDSDSDDWGKLKRANRNDPSLPLPPPSPGYDDVMSRYFDFSPIPLSPGPAPRRQEDVPVSFPERLHVRRYGEGADLGQDGALPPTPGPGRVADKDLYDVVARKLSRQ